MHYKKEVLFWFGSSRFVRRSFYVYGESGFGNDGSDESGYEALSADETGDGTTGMGQIYDAKKVRE